MNNIRTPLIIRYFLILSVGCGLILSAEYLGIYVGISNQCHDLFFRLRGVEEPDRRILIAAIDEQTLSRLGQWPLKRTHFAKLLDVLGAARVVGLDILMSEPTDDDSELSAAIRRHGRVVLPASIGHPFTVLQPRSAGEPFRVGHIHLEQDIDGVVRNVYHTLYSDGHALPSFDSAMFEVISGKPLPREEPALFMHRRSRGADIFQLDSRRINYHGEPGTFPQVSMVDIIDGRYPPAYFTNKIVLVGLTADGLNGSVLTPFSQLRGGMSGIEVHANILNNLISRNHIVEAPETMKIAASLFCALAGFVLFLRAGGWHLLVWWTIAIVVALLASYWAFSVYQLWFSPVLFFALLSFMFVFAYVIKLEQTGKMLREAEAEWRDSFDTINDGIVLVDGSGMVTRMNEAARSMRTPHLLELLAESHHPGSADGNSGSARMEELLDPVSGNTYEVRTLSRSGRDNRSAGVVHVLRDITAPKKMAEEREILRYQFHQAQKMESIGQLAGGIAHDFNNILTVIIGYSEMALKKAGQDKRLAESLRIINESSLKAASLIRQLLVFSRKNTMELQVVNIGTIAENMAKILGRVIGEDISLTIQTQTSVSNVLADPGHIEQIIMNLAVNARDAMPKGGTLDIRVADIELDQPYASSHLDVTPGPYVMLEVSDSGFGMNPDTQARIFEPFYTTKKAGKGTGLGLSTVYGIVKRMSGHIYVYSEVGMGTVFKLYFPVCEEQSLETTSKVTDPPRGGSETILIAEDDAAILELIASSLETLGYNVLAASSGTEALQLAAQEGTCIDLLLTDVVMQGMGGRELADIVLEKSPNTRVLFMSGYTDETLVVKGVEKQHCYFIQKPLMPFTLARKLREVLDEECHKSG